MTLSELIAHVDQVKPNQYDKEIKTRWVTEVEAAAVEQILNRALYETEVTETLPDGSERTVTKWLPNDIDFDKYDYDMDQERELLIPDRFNDVYVNYLSAKVDYNNREFGSYQNCAAMYQASWNDFAAYWRRTHRPKPQPKMRYF